MEIPIVVFTLLFAAVGIWATWRIAFWLSFTSPLDNIHGPRSSSWWTGSFGLLFDSKRGLQYHQDISDKYGAVSRIYGPFGSRALYIFDPEALRAILINKQAVFDHSPWILARNRLVFGQSLFSVVGEDHRRYRRLLNPTFSEQHMKLLAPVLYDVARRLCEGIRNELGGKPGEVDILEWTARSALEAIGHVGCGYSFDSLTVSKQRHPIVDALKDLVPALMDLNIFLPVVTYLASLKKALRTNLAEMARFAKIQRLKRVVDILDKNSKDLLARKSQEEDSHSIFPHTDMLTSLMEKDGDSCIDLTEEEIVANLTSILFGGTDTTSNALASILQQLAQHPLVQDTLRAEIAAASSDGIVPHDELVNLPYLDAVCRETLRLHPPAPISLREAMEDTQLPLSRPIVGVNGTVMDSILVPKRTTILISILSGNRNKDVWGEDALEWKPERWLSPLPDSVTEARIPGVYPNSLTFLAGKRACIGWRFSQLELKILLSTLISTFKFSLTDRMIVWNFGAVNFPTSEGYKCDVCLPLQVATLVSADFQHNTV